ncbi:uncharacterized protein TNCV_2577721 [Trichonephila clavipes]|nr:uncharacterized protein TNCV_2577721 [Trichonephila clavipes]
MVTLVAAFGASGFQLPTHWTGDHTLHALDDWDEKELLVEPIVERFNSCLLLVTICKRRGHRSAVQTTNCRTTRGLLATDHVILNHGQVTWTTPELAPPLLTTTSHQREDVSALDRFNVHRCPSRRVFRGTGLELVTRQATIRSLYHSKVHSNSRDAQLNSPSHMIPDMLDWRRIWGSSRPRKGSNSAETVL